MLLAAVFRHCQSRPPPQVSLFLGPFLWWYLCSRTLHFVEARCCDVSPTSSSVSPVRTASPEPPNRRLPGCLVFGLEDGSCPRPTASAHLTYYTAVALYCRTGTCPGTCTCTSQVAPKHKHKHSRRARGSAPAAARPGHSKTGSPHRHLRHPPRAISRRILPPVASRCGPASAFAGRERFAPIRSAPSSPSACDLRPVHRKPLRAGNSSRSTTNTQHPPFRPISLLQHVEPPPPDQAVICPELS